MFIGINDFEECELVNYSLVLYHKEFLKLQPYGSHYYCYNFIRKNQVCLAVHNSNNRLNSVLYKSYSLYSVCDVMNYSCHLFTEVNIGTLPINTN